MYPALALASRVKKRGMDVLFVGRKGSGIAGAAQKEGFSGFEIACAPFPRSLFSVSLFSAGFFTMLGFYQALRVLQKTNPSLVLGMGGYASVPVVFAARMLRIPVALHEQNLIPGRAIRFLSRFSKTIYLGFDKTAGYFGGESVCVTGVPVREQFQPSEEISGIDFSKKTVLFFGGSQGARKLNQVVLEILPELHASDFCVVHILGKGGFEEFYRETQEAQKKFFYYPFPYLQSLLSVMEKAHLVVCRAGASTCAELCALGKPSILIPYPFAVENHQEQNANYLQEMGAAEKILDSELTAALLLEEIKTLFLDEKKLLKMAESARKFSKPDAADRIAENLEKLLTQSEK